MKKVTLIAIFTLSALGTTAQVKSLTSGEFFPFIHKAGDSTNAVPYRSVSTNRNFVDGVPSLDWTQTKEVLNSETRRVVQKEDGKVIEVISIARKNYQRENGGAWREVGTPENVYLFRGIGGPHTSEYYYEDVIKNGVKYAVLTWYIKEQSGRFSESKTYIAPNGKIFREESRGGTVDPKVVLWDEIVEYEYDVGRIRIGAPIIPKTKSISEGRRSPANTL